MKELLIAGLLLAAATCKQNQQAGHLPTGQESIMHTQDTTIAGTWYLMPVLASDTAAGKIPHLNFDLSEKRFSGNTGCNNMSGSFEINHNALSFGANMVSTKMACQGYNEKPFMDNLLKTNGYEIKDGVLQLMYNTTILSKWTRNTDTSSTKKI
jgi:heat shock protein HslJ